MNLRDDEGRRRPPAPQPDADEADLARFGYSQQLDRSMGLFSSFALSFSLVSVITGIFANFTFGYRQVGPAIAWSWSVVAVGQFLVALVLADLSSRIPLSGYGYQWSSRLVNPHYGFFVGWLLLMQFLTGFPGVCHALASVACAWTLSPAQAVAWTPWVAVGVVSGTALVHLFGIRLVSVINDAGVVAELAGTLAMTGILWGLFAWSGLPERLALFSPAGHGGVGISAFAISLLMGAWCLTGFEAAADLAEETRRPRWMVPRVMLLAEAGSGLLGLLLVGGLIVNLDEHVAASQTENLVVEVLRSTLGATWMPLAMAIVCVSILACAVASMAATTRLVFSLARDNMLPASNRLKAVSSRWRTPVAAIVLVWLTSTAVILGFRQLEIITSVSAAAGYVGYAGILGASLRAQGSSSGFSLGRLQTPVRLAALAWSLLVVMALTIPNVDNSADSIGHLPAKSTLVVGVGGCLLYFGLIRRRVMQGVAGPPRVTVPECDR